MKLKAYAKINLSLDITGKRENGYHDIESIMQSVSLYDVVSIEKNHSGKITVKSDNKDIPEGEENIAYKAARQMIEDFDLNCGFDIFIEKHIPVAGGMAGGSTNAAAVIRGINEICSLNLTNEEMMKTGVKIGADVPFCIQQSAALCEGIGEVITPLKGLSKDLWILLVNPNIKVSTKLIYEKIDEKVSYNTVDNKSLINALGNGDVDSAKNYMKNVMQVVSETECEEISTVIKEIKSLGAIHSMMSGSGATCFGIFKEKPDLEKSKKVFKDYFVEIANPI